MPLIAALLTVLFPACNHADPAIQPPGDAGRSDLTALRDTRKEAAPAADGAVDDGADTDQSLPPPDAVAATDSDPPPPLLPENVTMFVNLGDSLADGAKVDDALSYRSLLLYNHDARYPAFQGQDLTTLFPGIRLVDESDGGDTTADVIRQAQAVPGNPSGNTLVVISAGGNDFINAFYVTAFDPAKTADVARTATSNLAQAVAHFGDRQRYPGEVYLVIFNVHDPTDEMGSIPLGGGELTGHCIAFQIIGALGVTATANLAVFNDELAQFATTSGVALADNHAAFLGHGFHHDNPQSTHYDAQNPTLWFDGDCIHASERGHHEMRRLVWQVLFGTVP